MRAWSAQGAKVPRKVPEHHAGEDENRGDEGAGPASAEVGELGDGLSKEDLISVALEVAKDRSAEDGGDYDDSEERGEDVVIGIGVGAVEQDLAVPAADGPKLSEATQRKENTSQSRKYA